MQDCLIQMHTKYLSFDAQKEIFFFHLKLVIYQ